MKKLYRSETDKKIGGIVGGLGEYFELDSALLRLIVLFIIFVTGIVPGIISYIVALLVAPKRNLGKENKTSGLDKINTKSRENISEAKEKIMSLAREKGVITNNDIEKLLGVSDATTTRYFDELEKEGKLRQRGSGSAIEYEVA